MDTSGLNAVFVVVTSTTSAAIIPLLLLTMKILYVVLSVIGISLLPGDKRNRMKSKETKLRSRLSAQGYGLRKFHDVYGVAGYLIVDGYNVIVCGSEQFPLSLDEVADFVDDM
jgi:hypothetical protein